MFYVIWKRKCRIASEYRQGVSYVIRERAKN